MNKITYITYQSFPAETANSLQTISNIKYFVRNNISVSLYFPLRETQSLGSLEVIQKQYGINEDFQVCGVKHFLPFGRVDKFKKTVFHVSHFIWSGWVVNKYFNQPKKGEVFNIGGGLYSNCSILEAIDIIEKFTNKKIKTYINKKNRVGDHIWYVSNTNKFKNNYPGWKQKYNSKKIIEELIENN